MSLSQEFADLAEQIAGMNPSTTNVVEALTAIAKKSARLAYLVETIQLGAFTLLEKQALQAIAGATAEFIERHTTDDNARCANCCGTGSAYRHSNGDYVPCPACNGKGR